MCLVMSRIIISQLCLSTSILIHDVDLSRRSWWWCASLALNGIFAFSGGVVVLWFLILLYINLYGDRCYYVSIISVGIIISKFTDVIFIYVLPLVWVYGCCDRCILVKFVFSVAIIFLFLIAAVF